MAQVLRKKDVSAKVGFSYSTIQRLINKDKFPKPFSLPGYNVIGWLESDIDEWIVKQATGSGVEL